MSLLQEIIKCVETSNLWKDIVSRCINRNLSGRNDLCASFVESVSWNIWKEILASQNDFKIVNEIERKYEFLPFSLTYIVSKDKWKRVSQPRKLGKVPSISENLLIDIQNHIEASDTWRKIVSQYTNGSSTSGNIYLDFAEAVTWDIWKEIFIFKKDHEIIHECEQKYKFNQISREESSVLFSIQQAQLLQPEICDELCPRIYEWRAFARVLQQFEDTMIEQINRDIFKVRKPSCEELSREVIRRFQAPHIFKDLWCFWKIYLNRFENGREIIRELESKYLTLMMQDSDKMCHFTIINQRCFIGHLYINKKNTQFFIDVENCENIRVNIGSTHCDTVCYQNFNEWLLTKDRYFGSYKMFEDVKAINLCNIDEPCSILQCFELFLDQSKDKGFIMRGYSFRNHLKLFNENAFAQEETCDVYFAYIANDNIIFHFYVCTELSQIRKIFDDEIVNFQIAEVLHGCLRESNVIHMNIIICDDVDVKEGFSCTECIDKKLFVDRETVTNIDKMKDWYESAVTCNKRFQILKKQMLSSSSETRNTSDIAKYMKQNIIGFQALTTYVLPTFTEFNDIQMDELKKLVFLTPNQFKIMHSNNKHVIIKGGYGSGKTLVLQKKFEQVVEKSSENEVCCFICYDQQSKLIKEINYIASRYPDKNVLVCNSYELVKQSLNLLTILKFLRNTFLGKTVQVFIDEYYDTGEKDLTDVLKGYENSYVYIAYQSMEKKQSIHVKEAVAEENSGTSINGTSFICYALEYSLRCSVEINLFVRNSVEILESLTELQCNFKIGDPLEVVVDDEYTGDTLLYNVGKRSGGNYCYNYNFPLNIGHEVHSSPVNIYFINEQIQEEFNSIYGVVNDLIKTDKNKYFENDDLKYVVSTLDSELFFELKNCLNSSSFSWTENLEAFSRNDDIYNILLTDYASLRGLEFQNVIILLSPRQRLLKYRLIEMFTRATTNLHVIVKLSADAINTFQYDQLFEKWRKLRCVEIHDYVYDEDLDNYYFKESYECKRKTQNLHKKSSTKREENENLSSNKFQWANTWHTPSLTSWNNEKAVIVSVITKIDNVALFDEMVGLHEELLHELNNVTLHVAAFHGSLNIVKYLVNDMKIPVNKLDTAKNTPLHYAVLKETNLDIVEFLLSKNADSNAKDINNNTPLHNAVKANSVKVTKLLLQKVTDANVKNNFDEAPLCLAIKFNNYKMIKVLLESGVDPNINYNNSYYPLLNFAVEEKYFAVAKLLLEKGANPNLKDNHGISSLHYAVKYNNVEIVKMIVTKNGDPNIENNDGQPLLQVLFSIYFEPTSFLRSHFQIIDILLKNGANPNILINGYTPLHLAIKAKDQDMTKTLLEQGANPNLKDNQGNSSLHSAAKDNNVEAVKMIIAKNGDPNIENNDGRTPLQVLFSIFLELTSFLRSHSQIIDILLKNGANPNILIYGYTPLHLAIKAKDEDMTKTLLRNGANPNMENSYCMVPLDYAIETMCLKIAKLLVDGGASLVDHSTFSFAIALDIDVFSFRTWLQDQIYDFVVTNFTDKQTTNSARLKLQFTFLSSRIMDGKIIYSSDCDWLALLATFKMLLIQILIKSLPFHTHVEEDIVEIEKFMSTKLFFKNCFIDYDECIKDAECMLQKTEIFISQMNNSHYYGLVKLLLEKGANPNVKNCDGITPLYVALINSDIDVLKLLLEGGADPNLCDDNGSTPLHYAAFISKVHFYHSISILEEFFYESDAPAKVLQDLSKSCWYGVEYENIRKSITNIAILMSFNDSYPDSVDIDDRYIMSHYLTKCPIPSFIEYPTRYLNKFQTRYFKKNTRTIELLLEKGADPYRRNIAEITPYDLSVDIRNMLENVSL